MKIKRFEFNMFPVNSYVLSDDTNEAVIIDAGCYFPQDEQNLKRYIEDNNLTVKHLINTHLHLDHVFGNAFVERTFGVKPEASEADEFLLARLEQQCRMFGFEPNEPTVALGTHLKGGDKVTFGNTTIDVIDVPGHSPGGLAYYIASEHCLFSGDSLFKGSIGRTDLEGGDFEALHNAVCTRLFTLPSETVVYPGHGEHTTIGFEKMNNPFFR